MMDLFCRPEVEKVTIIKSARIGYSQVIQNVIGYHMHHDPTSMLIVHPTIDDAEEWSKSELSDMLDQSPVLRELVSDKRDAGNTINLKRFPGGKAHIIGANSPRGFRRKNCRLVLFDEVDGYPATAGPEGDQIRLGTRRSDMFWDRKIAIGSTPTIDPFSRVSQSYAKSSKGVLLIPCPDCGSKHMRLFRQPDRPVEIRGEEVPVSFLQWDKDKPETAQWFARRADRCTGTIATGRYRRVANGSAMNGRGRRMTGSSSSTAFPGTSECGYGPGTDSRRRRRRIR